MNALYDSPIDRLDRELSDAFSQVVTISGEGFESFSSLNDTIQQAVLFSLENRIRGARDALEALVDERAKAREAKE